MQSPIPMAIIIAILVATTLIMASVSEKTLIEEIESGKFQGNSITKVDQLTKIFHRNMDGVISDKQSFSTYSELYNQPKKLYDNFVYVNDQYEFLRKCVDWRYWISTDTLFIAEYWFNPKYMPSRDYTIPRHVWYKILDEKQLKKYQD